MFCVTTRVDWMNGPCRGYAMGDNIAPDRINAAQFTVNMIRYASDFNFCSLAHRRSDSLSLITKSLPKTSFGHAGGTFFLCCVFFSFFSNLNSSRNFNAASVLLSHRGNHGNSERINIMQKPEKLCGPFFRFSSYPWLNAMKNILISIWQSTFTHNFTYATVFGWCRFFSRSRLFVRVFLSRSLYCFVVDWLLVTGNEAQILLY